MSGPQCCENPPAITKTPCGEGSVEELGGLNTYVTGPPDSKRAIILIADAFGYEAPLLRKLADKVAAEVYLVVVPDFFHGDPANPTRLGDPNYIGEWLAAHNPTHKGFDDAKRVVTALKSRGISSIGAAGFCWGGMVLSKLARSNYIQAAVILHPGPIAADDMKDVDIPVAILGAEFDDHCPPEEAKKLADVLSQKTEIESFVKIFPGTKHGWAIRYETDNEAAVKVAEEAQSDTLNWLIRYIK